jgi:NAD(P)-dependent dehydrogenase (short-subunit alcohol dehydrogenase family)
LLNNAGILPKSAIIRDALREVLSTNVIGAVSTTEAFLPLLKKSAEPRLIFVSSSMGSITHASNPESPYYKGKASEYRSSKAALNMLMVQYSKNLPGFKVFGADPGLVATNFMDADAVRARGAVEPDIGGKTIAEVVLGKRDKDVGKVCGRYGVSEW